MIIDDEGKVWASWPERCPRCGGELLWGYGLAGGGLGSYRTCNEDSNCLWMAKEQDRAATEPEPTP